MADFTATCDNTEQIGTDAAPCSFQVWDKNGKPARLDTANSPIAYAASGGGSVVAVAETTGVNGFPQYNFIMKSGTLDTETINVTIDADGQPGSGVAAFHAEGVLEVAATPANVAAFAIPAASPKV